ncbi:hypothetical protein BDY21DRAFT_268062, partial [Lineolata rhizophorae]
RLTLFTRSPCGLCDAAKAVLSRVRARRPRCAYAEVDVMAPGQARWKALYEFDAPVVHVDRVGGAGGAPAATATAAATKKLMHRFGEAQVEALMDEVEK